MLSKIKTRLKQLRAQLKLKKKTKRKTKAGKAHSPGHRKMGKAIDPKILVKSPPIDEMSNADLIRKNNARHRRIITGADKGKTGRITIKE